ncbi:MAG: hypothetical protein JWO36_5731 [Myxococcales bacterium]|nr:hypothetical protein [Myxococcales bacterium]
MRAPSPFVAALDRAPFLTMVAIGTGEILEVARCRVYSMTALERNLTDFARDYGADTLVVEPGSTLGVLGAAHRYRVVRLSLSLAKRTLLPDDATPTHARLYEHLLTRYPSLRRYSTANRVEGHQDPWARWRNEKLLAVALGLAARYRSLHAHDRTVDAPQPVASPPPHPHIVPSFH